MTPDQRRIEELEDQVEMLKRALGADCSVPVSLCLSPMEARLFGAMIARPYMSRESAMNALYYDRPSDEPGQDILQVFIHHMRQKLKKHGIAIHNRRGVGWYLDDETRATYQKKAA